jgi:DNA repair photolyase
MKSVPRNKARGRGQRQWIRPRYQQDDRESIDDGWWRDDDEEPLATSVTVEQSRTIISRNRSPDIPFEQSINPYRGCEHGCTYCYARPAHAYMDLSPGIDFETKLFAKPDAARLLEKELASKSYRCSPIALGANTDPYQPIERQWRITRQIIETLQRCRHPLTIVTKSALVLRDRDLLSAMAALDLVQVFISVTTLDPELARRMEPRAAAPWKRLRAIEELARAGIPVGVMFAPVIPALNDTEMENILARAAESGAISAGYVMLRLPHEVNILFREWLDTHYPLKSDHVMNMVKDIRGGRENDPEFKSRMRGQGVYADMIEQRFHKTCKRLGLNSRHIRLDTSKFIAPAGNRRQPDLF